MIFMYLLQKSISSAKSSERASARHFAGDIFFNLKGEARAVKDVEEEDIRISRVYTENMLHFICKRFNLGELIWKSDLAPERER